MVFGKTRTSVFREIGIPRSSLRIKFPDLRFEDFQFFPNIRKYFKNKKILSLKFFCSAKDFFYSKIFAKILNFFSENLFVRPKIYLFGRRFFCSLSMFFVRTNIFFFEKKKKKMTQNARELVRIF